MVLVEQKWLYLGNVLVFEKKLLYSGKVVVFCHKWLYSNKTGCNRAKMVLFGQTWLY